MRVPTQKTHPLVLIAATALTILSMLGSAIITGLIPSLQSERPDGTFTADLSEISASSQSKTSEKPRVEDKKAAYGKISQSSQDVK